MIIGCALFVMLVCIQSVMWVFKRKKEESLDTTATSQNDLGGSSDLEVRREWDERFRVADKHHHEEEFKRHEEALDRQVEEARKFR